MYTVGLQKSFHGEYKVQNEGLHSGRKTYNEISVGSPSWRQAHIVHQAQTGRKTCARPRQGEFAAHILRSPNTRGHPNKPCLESKLRAWQVGVVLLQGKPQI